MTNISNTFDIQHKKMLLLRKPFTSESFCWPVIFLFLFLSTFPLLSWSESQAETHFGVGITDEQLASDREWALSQPPRNYTIQLLAALKPHTVRKVISDYQLKEPIHIITTHYNNREWTVIISGSYSSYREVRKVIKQLPERLQQVEPSIWIRDFASLHEIIARPAIVEPEPVPEPVIYAFEVTSNTITAGETVALMADFTNGESFIDNDLGSIASNEPIYVTPSATTTYTLTVTNEAGITASHSVTIAVIEPELEPEPEPVPVPVTTVSLEEIATEMNEGQHRSLRGIDAINWIMERERKHYTVQLYTTNDLRDMEQFVAGKELPEDSAFYNIKVEGEMQHVLIFGDFSKRSQVRRSIYKVDKALRGGDVKKRRFKSLQKELEKAQY